MPISEFEAHSIRLVGVVHARWKSQLSRHYTPRALFGMGQAQVKRVVSPVRRVHLHHPEVSAVIHEAQERRFRVTER